MLLFLMIGCDEARIVQNTDSNPGDEKQFVKEETDLHCVGFYGDDQLSIDYTAYLDADGNLIEEMNCSGNIQGENYIITGSERCEIEIPNNIILNVSMQPEGLVFLENSIDNTELEMECE
jgi:hypothetical protein